MWYVSVDALVMVIICVLEWEVSSDLYTYELLLGHEVRLCGLTYTLKPVISAMVIFMSLHSLFLAYEY